MDCEFKVGDRVRVRNFYDMENQYGATIFGSIDPNPLSSVYIFSKHMRKYCGKCGTILEIKSRRDFYEICVDFDDKNLNDDGSWHFADYMFEYEGISELPDVIQLYDF